MNYFKESRETTGKQLNSETTLGTACEYTGAFNTQRYMLVYAAITYLVNKWNKNGVNDAYDLYVDMKHFNIQW